MACASWGFLIGTVRGFQHEQRDQAVHPRSRRGHVPCQSSLPELRGRVEVLRQGPCRYPAGRQERRRSEEHTSELQSRLHLVCRLLLEKKKQKSYHTHI